MFVVLAPLAVIGAGGLRFTLLQQLERPLQIETLAGSIVLVLGRLGVYEPNVVFTHSSHNLVGGLPTALSTVCSLVGLVALGLVCVAFARRSRSLPELLTAAAAAVTVYVTFGRCSRPIPDLVGSCPPRARTHWRKCHDVALRIAGADAGLVARGISGGGARGADSLVRAASKRAPGRALRVARPPRCGGCLLARSTSSRSQALAQGRHPLSRYAPSWRATLGALVRDSRCDPAPGAGCGWARSARPAAVRLPSAHRRRDRLLRRVA